MSSAVENIAISNALKEKTQVRVYSILNNVLRKDNKYQGAKKEKKQEMLLNVLKRLRSNGEPQKRDIEDLSQLIDNLFLQASFTTKISALNYASHKIHRKGDYTQGDFADEENGESTLLIVLQQYSRLMTDIILESTGINSEEVDDKVLEEVVEALTHVVSAMESD